MIDIVNDHIGAPPKSDHLVKPDVVVLLDESGSMGSHRSAVVSTFNEYVVTVRGVAKTVSLYTFDTSGIREKLFKVDPHRVKMLTLADYCPAAGTPLYDAMGQVINKFRYGNRAVQFTTHTDGMENASQEFTKARLDELIADVTMNQGWLFTYLMEGIEGRAAMADFQGLKMGFSPENRGMVYDSFQTATINFAATANNNPLDYTSNGLDTIDVDAGEQVKKVTVQDGDHESVTSTTTGGTP